MTDKRDDSLSEQVERDIRIAIWNAAKTGGMGDDLARAFINRAMDEPCMKRTLTRPTSGDAVEAGKVRDTPSLRASRESLGISQDEQRRRAMAAANKMKAEGTASKPGPATTEALAQTEQGGERADLQGQKQSADTTATPPTPAQTDPWEGNPAREGMPDDWGDGTSTAQTEAMAGKLTARTIADLILVADGAAAHGFAFHEVDAGEAWGNAVQELGLDDGEHHDRAHILTTLRQPASVEAEPVAWAYEEKDRIHPIKLLTNQRWDEEERERWTETPLYAHTPADAEPVALLRDIADEVRDPDGAGTLPTDLMARIDAHLAEQVQS